MDEERRRKIEAGKSKWAEFKKKKNRSAKSNISQNASATKIQENRCISDSVQMVSEKEIPACKQISCVKDSSSSQEDSSTQPTLIMDKTKVVPDRQSTLESNSSFESFVLEGAVGECDSPSRSDNSTITGTSDSSQSDSTTTNGSSENSHISSKLSEILPVPKSLENPSLFTKSSEDPIFADESQNSQLPFAKSSENPIPVMKTKQDEESSLNAKENVDKFLHESVTDFIPSDISKSIDQKILPVNVITKDISLIHSEDNVSAIKNLPVHSLHTLTEADDDHFPVLNDDTELVSLYEKKLKKYQEAIQQRDSVISQLSKSLESAVNANHAASSARNDQVEKLQEEIYFLQLKMKETVELLNKLKSKNGNLEYENCAIQTENAELVSKLEAGIQVETSINSLLQSCDLDSVSFIELFIKKFSSDSESSHQMVQKLSEVLLSQFSHVHIQELMTMFKSNLNLPESNVLENTESAENASDKNNLQACDKPDNATVLKKIISLNMVAKLIESLISISSGGANDSFPDFSPSKFQSFFLKRMHSVEAGDVLPDASESESFMSDYNYAEVDTPCSKLVLESSPLEKLRKRNISDDFSIVTDFLQDEMDKICSLIPSISAGPHGDGSEFQEDVDSKEKMSATLDDDESDHKKILLHKSKLETRLKNLKSLDKELHDVQHILHQASIDSDTMTMSEDNLLMEEPPLSCVSLLSLTDSEYKGDNITTDSETNFSRKVSLDMTRSMQEREFCIRCERNFDLWKEKYENDLLSLKESLENSYAAQKNNFLESKKNLEAEIDQLKQEKENLNKELNDKIEFLCSENEMKMKKISEDYDNQLSILKISENECIKEKDELEAKLKELEEKLTHSNRSILDTLDEKAKVEITLQNQIADLIQEHEQDLEALKLENEAKICLEKKQMENNYKSSIEILKKVHEKEMNDLKCQIIKEFDEREQNLLNEHSKTINMIEAAHCDESAVYQKKIEQLLEEKCELLSKTTQEYETILKKNHRALVMLCKQLLAKINVEKERIINESLKSGGDLDISFSEAFDQLNRSLESGLVKFLNQNYFINASNEEFSPDDTEYLPIELSFPIGEEDMPPKIDMNDFRDASKKGNEINEGKNDHESSTEPGIAPSESSLDSDDLYMIHTEINKLQEEFQKDVAFYKDINDQLHREINLLKKQVQELEDQKENLETQLQEKEKELSSKDSLLSAMDAAAVKSGSQLSATDIKSWQVQAAQTNSRLLHVLSDLVKTFLDIENDINAHLLEYGLIPSRTGTLIQHDDDTGQSVGSREDFTSLSLGDCPNLELTEDGPDLTPRAWDVFATTGNYDTDLEGEDVVLGASRRLRLAVDHVLSLLGRALENQQNQDLKLLLKRNEELSHELQEESQGRDAVHMELVTAESTVRKLESEKQRLEDINRDMKEEYEMLKRELSVERNKVSHLQQEKESAYDEIHTLKEQCELLSSRLGDPERKAENDKLLNSSGTHLHENPELLEENSRLSSEKHTVQKNLSKERQSFLDRLHQMEIALDELNAEKDDLVEKKCKEIRDLKAEMEAMEKQLQSNRKFIEQQAMEREQEREEFIKEINKMQDFVREKEKIQSSETQLTKEIESLEQLLRARIEDHKNAMAKKDEVEKELRQSLDKIRDLREVIEELEKQLDIKSRVEAELRQKLSVLYESIPNQDKNHSHSDSSDSIKNLHLNGDSIEQLHSLKEQLASQSQDIEMMSQSQTLLHELRGQIHFLEAKVEQRARLLETNLLSSTSSPVQSGATSPSGSQDSESLQIPCEEGWEMSPRSIHWLEIRRLEEKIGRLAHIDEELLKRNKELEQQLKKIKASHSECQHENTALQEKLSEQLMQISALKSHIDEQKHRCSTPQKTHSFAEKIEELQEELEKQIENNKRLMSDFQETQVTLNALQDEFHKKDEMIAALQNNSKENCSVNEEVSEFSRIDKLHNQLTEKMRVIDAIEKENRELKVDIEYLKTENSSMKSLLEKAEKELGAERAQVETLCEEMANLTENSREVVISTNKYNSNDSNEPSINEEKQDCDSKSVSWETRLKEKNLEILTLKATITKLETSLRARERDLQLEQVQVETLLQELGSLTSYQKRLEQDFNTVQDMMQQKERELSTLQEETEAQMKLEATIEALEKELTEKRNANSILKEKIQQLESQLEFYSTLEEKIEKKNFDIKELQVSHSKEICELNKQIEVLKKCNIFNENNIDIEELVSKIMDVAETFQSNESDKFREILVSLLNNSVTTVINQLKKEHENNVVSINKSWQDKVSEEIKLREKNFKFETEKLLQTFQKEKEKIAADKDEFWQNNIKDIELKLKNEQERYEKLFDNAKLTKNEIQGMYTDEIHTLRQNLESTLKEKVSLENVLKDLKNEIEKIKQAKYQQKNILSKDYETKLSAISRTIKESFEKEKEKIIALHQQKINELQTELNLRLGKENEIEAKHKEELSAIHKYFETRWANEMKKLQDFQSEDLKKMKDNNEIILEDKIQKAKEEFSAKISKEKENMLLHHKQELEQLQNKFEKERKLLLGMKEKAVQDATEVLEKKFNANLAEIQKKISSSSLSKSIDEQGQKKWEEEKVKLISLHRKEMAALKQELKSRYEKQLQSQSAAHSAEIKRLEESYNKQVEEVHDLIKEAKRAASKTGYSDCGSNRTTTPSSDITSSDEACSSCQEDMLSANRHILVDKIHQDGKRVLSLIESSAQPFSYVKEAHLWLDERKWIINKLKTVTPVTSNTNLKIVIGDLVDEVLKFRRNFEAALEENSDLKQKCEELEQQISYQYSKLCDVTSQLKKQKSTNSELESLLSSKITELSDVKKSLQTNSKSAQLSAEKETYTPNSESCGSPYEIGCLRSGDGPRSAEKFSMFLPDISNTPFLEQKTPNNQVVDETTIPKVEDSPLLSVQSISPPTISNIPGNEMSKVKEKLMAVLNKGVDTTDVKLHGLYWVYRRSQSYNRALIYQKKYLLMLLRDFLVTEKVTLAWLNHMDTENSPSPMSDGTVTDPLLSARSRFRSAVFVVIALQRMKLDVKRWRQLARIPSSQVINNEIRFVFQNYSFLSPALSPGYHLSSHSLASVPISLTDRDCKSSHMSTSSRAENKSRNSAKPDKNQLIEYVHRLEVLQKQLGLDSLR